MCSPNIYICALCMLFFSLIHLETYCCPTHKHILLMQYKSIHFPSSEQTPKIFLGYIEWASVCTCALSTTSCSHHFRYDVDGFSSLLLLPHIFSLVLLKLTPMKNESRITYNHHFWPPILSPNEKKVAEIIPKSTNDHWDLRSLTGVDLRNDM